MTMHILSDVEQELSVIWDDNTGRSYGYVTSGPGHAEMLQAFIDGLETHIAAYEPHELAGLWDEFVKTIEEVRSERTAEEEPAPPESAQEAPGGPPAPEPVPDTSPEPESPQEPAGEPTEEEVPEDPTMPLPDSSTPLINTGGTSQTQQEQDCWNCGGSGIERVTGQKCGVCEGSGKVYTPPVGSTA